MNKDVELFVKLKYGDILTLRTISLYQLLRTVDEHIIDDVCVMLHPEGISYLVDRDNKINTLLAYTSNSIRMALLYSLIKYHNND